MGAKLRIVRRRIRSVNSTKKITRAMELIASSRIVNHLLPQYVIARVYAGLLESAASENASRRRAMKAATDNAEELIKVLTRQANRARQDEITTEIMEIVGGAEALAASSGG